MRSRLAVTLTVVVACIAVGVAGCGGGADDVVQRVGSDARAVIDEARGRYDDDVARAREHVEDALAAADDDGVPVPEARRAAERAIDRARRGADAAIREAERRGLDDEAARLRRRAERELERLRDRLDGVPPATGY